MSNGSGLSDKYNHFRGLTKMMYNTLKCHYRVFGPLEH